MLIDRYLPSADAAQLRHTIVEASVHETFEAVRRWDPTAMSSRGVRLLVWLRGAPEQAWRTLTRRPEPASPGTQSLLDWGWIELGVQPDAELALGLVGRFWNPVIRPRRLPTADAFRAFDEPGYAKLVISFSVRPYGEQRSLLSYEARTACTSAAARRRFRWYWLGVGPFAGYLMSRALVDIRADAEAARRAPAAATT